jgi:hypothetical protein
MTREIIFEPATEFNDHKSGWTAWDGEYRDPIPGTTEKSSFAEAVDAAVRAWGVSWKDATESDFDDSTTA